DEANEGRGPAHRTAVPSDDAQPPRLHAERLPAAHPKAPEEEHDDRREAQAIPERSRLDRASRERKQREREHEEQGREQQEVVAERSDAPEEAGGLDRDLRPASSGGLRCVTQFRLAGRRNGRNRGFRAVLLLFNRVVLAVHVVSLPRRRVRTGGGYTTGYRSARAFRRFASAQRVARHSVA